MAMFPHAGHLNARPGRHFGPGAGLAPYYRMRGDRMNRYVGTQWSQIMGGLPSGYNAGGAYVLPIHPGGISSSGTPITVTPGALTLSAGINISGTSTIVFTVPNALLQLVVDAAGSATITFSASATLAGAVSATGDASFAFTAGPALLGAITNLTANGSIMFSGSAALTAFGNLAGDITPFTTLSPENLANAVWKQVIDSGFQAQQILRLIAAVNAGEASGLDASPAFKSLDGSKTRVAGTVTSTTRTITSRDAS